MSQTSDVDALERLTVAAFALTTRVLGEVTGPDLTLLGWRAIVVLGEGPSELRSKELATSLRLSRPSCTRLVQRLQHRGLLAVARHGVDARGRFVRLTAEGVRLREAVVRRRRELLAQAIADDVPEDFHESLRVVADRLMGLV